MSNLPARLLALATSLTGPDAETARQAAEVIERLTTDMERIMFMGMDCPPMADQGPFYRAGMIACVCTAARAIEMEKQISLRSKGD